MSQRASTSSEGTGFHTSRAGYAIKRMCITTTLAKVISFLLAEETNVTVSLGLPWLENAAVCEWLLAPLLPSCSVEDLCRWDTAAQIWPGIHQMQRLLCLFCQAEDPLRDEKQEVLLGAARIGIPWGFLHS